MLCISGLLGCRALGSHHRDVLTVDRPVDTERAEQIHRRGVQLAKLGQLQLAERAFHNALLADENYGPSHNNLGLAYFDKRDFYSAAWAFERAIQSMPYRAEPYNNLGLTLEAAEKLDEAIIQYQAAHDIEPSNPMYLGNLIRARRRRGDLDESIRHLLKQLIFIETRDDWSQWAREQLAVIVGPYLDRPAQDTSVLEEVRPVPAEVLPPPSGGGPEPPPTSIPAPGEPTAIGPRLEGHIPPPLPAPIQFAPSSPN